MQIDEEMRSRLSIIFEKLRNSDFSLISNVVCGRPLNGLKGFEASVLGVKYKVFLADYDFKVDFEDPLGRFEDSYKLFGYMLNAFERAFAGRFVGCKKGLTKIIQLPGGGTAQLYERRITNFLAAEMDGADVGEVEEAAKNLGGCMVEHPNATWSFEVNPFNGVRIRVVYWEGEEEIPPGAAILLGEEVKEVNMPIEELIIIIEIAVNRLVQFYRKATNRKPRVFDSLYL
ncbi:MAG: DUF3786 domain-containing protein [Candidatus Bathyarchaeia archaeon]